ncbi:AMP-binding protein [Anaerolineales bacterium HSG24]|nr:AMP-binding protein [Anaerolineales bacterium HSG24]
MTRPTTINQLLLEAMERYQKQPCFKIKQSGLYYNVSYKQVQTLTFRMINFFHRQGLTKGERVALAFENGLEWMIIYLACLLAGGTIVPLRLSLSPDTIEFILDDSGASLAVLKSKEHIQQITASRRTGRLPRLKTVLVSPDETDDSTFTTSIHQILREAEPLSLAEQMALQSYASKIPPSALSAIYYVTNEVGKPRGAVFDQHRILVSMRHIAGWLTMSDDERAFTSRPLSETTALTTSLYYFISGILNVLPDDEEIIETMQQTSPTVMLGITYSLERFYEDCLSQIKRQPRANQQIFQWALAKGQEYFAAGANASPRLQQEYNRADLTFFSQFRGQTGGRLKRLYTTGATLTKDVVGFFEAIGVPPFNIYSLTEAGGFPAAISRDNYRTNSCGKATSGFEVRIAEDGEILLRGDSVMREYWQRPDETIRAFEADGWLRSGDEGRIDEDGYLYVTGRKHQLMVLSTGRKFAPSVVENALIASDYIKQVVIFGEGKPYISAMIVPDLEKLADHFETVRDESGRQITSTAHPQVKKLLEQIIAEVNRRLDKWEQVHEFNLLEQPFSQDAGELTPSMRISRHVVAEKYADQIEAMYPDSPQLDAEAVSQVQLDPERLRDLLEKETILDAWMADAGIEFLFDLALIKQIDPPSMVNICDTAASIAQMESEEKPLSTAIIIGDPVKIARILPPSQIRLFNNEHIRRMRRVMVSLAKMVDGHVLGYVVDKYGYVRGINKLEVSLEQRGNLLLGPQFRHHAAISRSCDAIVFFVPAGGRQIRVFANGDLVGRYADGDWSPERISHIDQTVAQLGQEKRYDFSLVQRILRCAFQMSERNLGAIFILGDADTILKKSDTSEISSFATIIKRPLKHLSDQALINFAKQDGATVIDNQGDFRGCMVLLRPDANTQAEIGPGKGARHSSAAKMSAEAHCLSVTVSQDGPITMYDRGKRVLSV